MLLERVPNEWQRFPHVAKPLEYCARNLRASFVRCAEAEIHRSWNNGKVGLCTDVRRPLPRVRKTVNVAPNQLLAQLPR